MDSVKKQVDRWYLKFRQYFFKYSNGFYELPILVNSPDLMVQGLAKMNFVKYYKEKNLLSSNTLFSHSELIHLELEDNLTLILSKSMFKKNIKFKFFYDKSIPAEHYFLRYQITRKESQNRSALSNGIPYSVNTWLFYKPGSCPDNHYFKDTTGVFFTIYFTGEWLKKFLDNWDAVQRKGIEHFLNSPQEYIMYPDDRENNAYQLFQEAINLKPNISDIHMQDFEATTYRILEDFMNCLNDAPVSEGFFQLSNGERLKIIQAEKYLRKYLTKDFPGIEHIADKVGIAQTSLKDGFRVVYGRTVYKYYQGEKMQMAAEMLSNNPDMKIAQLALQMGYENAGKFTAAFKENIGVTPTEFVAKELV